jgi:hypothetical protein
MASRFDPNALLIGAGPPAAGYFALAAIPARYALERRAWQDAEQLASRATPFPFADAITWFARGLGAARLEQTAAANEASAALRLIHERLLSANEMYWARQVEIQALAVSAWSTLASGAAEEAVLQMESAARLEDTTEKSVVTPGPLSPARAFGRDVSRAERSSQGVGAIRDHADERTATLQVVIWSGPCLAAHRSTGCESKVLP